MFSLLLLIVQPPSVRPWSSRPLTVQVFGYGLEAQYLKKLKTIFPISIALPQLEWLELKSNAELEHVFGRSDWDCTWQCPFLKDLFLEDCPKLSTEFASSIQNPSTTEFLKENG